jgi:hypothetical protein
MNDKAFAVESQTRTGRSHHDIATTLQDALQFAACCLRCWLELDECDKALAEQIRSMFVEGKEAEAIDLWNEHSSTHHIAIHEIEFTKRDCHRESLVPGDGIRYAVETTYDGTSQHRLYVALDEALAFVSLVLSRLPAKKPVRRKVRRLLREGKRIEALDAWNQGNIDPQVAIHQIKLVKANCHHDS